MPTLWRVRGVFEERSLFGEYLCRVEALMHETCKFNDNKVCAFAGKDGSGTLYCALAKTSARGNHIQTNIIERMEKCPRKRKRR